MPPQTRGWNLFFKVPPQTRDRDLSFTARPTDTPVPSTMESDNLMKLNIDKKKKYFLLGTGILWVALAAFLSGKSPLPTQAVPLSQVSPPGGLCGTFNPYSSLSVPTQITRIGDDYFLVDCYHNQILTSTSPETPLSEWQVMTDLINRGHTIAGDGTVCLADDTENNRILVFQKIKGRYFLSQVLENIGLRPHYVCYDQEEERFLALSSMTGELYVFRRSPDSRAVALEKILSIPELEGVYVRFQVCAPSPWTVTTSTFPPATAPFSGPEKKTSRFWNGLPCRNSTRAWFRCPESRINTISPYLQTCGEIPPTPPSFRQKTSPGWTGPGISPPALAEPAPPITSALLTALTF